MGHRGRQYESLRAKRKVGSGIMPGQSLRPTSAAQVKCKVGIVKRNRKRRYKQCRDYIVTKYQFPFEVDSLFVFHLDQELLDWKLIRSSKAQDIALKEKLIFKEILLNAVWKDSHKISKFDDLQKLQTFFLVCLVQFYQWCNI